MRTKQIQEYKKALIGKNEHSVYLRCNSCHTWGIGFELDIKCGNCGSEDTMTYYNIETIADFIEKTIQKVKKEERKKVIAEVILDLKERFILSTLKKEERK